MNNYYDIVGGGLVYVAAGLTIIGIPIVCLFSLIWIWVKIKNTFERDE